MTVALDKKRFGPWALVTGASSGIGKEFAQARSDTLGSNIGAPRLRGRPSQILSSRVVLAVTGLSV
jgi:NAD(P)-dependent dehydrogenase (short-subunit alcohol dehydrogenase family)